MNAVSHFSAVSRARLWDLGGRQHGLKQVTSASSLERLKFKLNMVVYAVLQECSLLIGAESRYAKPCEHGVSP